MANEFLVSTAVAYAFDSDDNLVLFGDTMLDTSIENSIANTDVRAGQGNMLQYIYYHSADLNITINNAQFSLNQLALAVGDTATTGGTVFTEETVAVTLGVGAVTGATPLASQVATIYGWAFYTDTIDGVITPVEDRVVFSTKAFTLADTTYTGNVCIRYFATDSAASHIDINANMIPSIVKLVLKAQLCSSDSSLNKIGDVIVTIYKAQASGAFTLSMTPDGVASTPLTFRAVAYAPAGGSCTAAQRVYGTIDKVLTGVNWYDNITSLSIVGGDFELANGETELPEIRAIPNDGTAAFRPDYQDLTFAATTVSVDNTTAATRGTITGATGGGSVLITITDKSTVDLTVLVGDGT
jgi:hypothetical protein